ncbi:MAG TPA: ABC transporter ATP-binding protein/permease [Candidatus Stackebrandtia excrementipullorum]|nr:ABC transporter ATP-binding protein/permease [Candidatus Stackebrandtia excrementipullorum]
MTTDTSETPQAEAVSLFAPVRRQLVWVVVLSVISSVAATAPLIAVAELGRVVWPLITGKPVDTAHVWAIVAAAAVALVLGFTAAWASTMVGHLADARLQQTVRTRVIDLLGRLPLGWFGTRSSGAVKKIVGDDVSALHHLTGHALHDLTTATVVPLLSLTYLFATQWRMALVCLVPLVVTVVLYTIMMVGGQEQLKKYDTSVERLNATTVEFVHGIAVIKSFGHTGREHARYADETRRFMEFYRGWMGQTSLMQTVVEVLTSPLVVLVWVVSAGSWLITSGQIAPTDLLPAVILGLGLTAPLLQLGYAGQAMRNATRARDSITEFLQQSPMPSPTTSAPVDGSSVRLDTVDFAYDDRNVLHRITLTCKPGTVTALVGASGSGKSTLARLIPRFHDVNDGAVRIGDTDVRDLAPTDLHAHVGFVFQDTHLLRTTVRDNIRLTRPHATHARVESAARAAHIHHRIERLPRGYDSVVGQDAHFSGGEAQRLTIARALVTDAPILVLDEATAALDPDSEADVQKAVSTLAADRSLVVIAHRLHTIVDADQIVVLDEGRIVQRGTHRELLAATGTYLDLWERHERVRNAADTAGEGR